MQEPWYKPENHGIAIAELWQNSLYFLMRQNYLPVTGEPTSGDIIMYFHDTPERAEHFALFDRSAGAVSKFGMGPLVRHPVEFIPTDFGSKYMFMRKSVTPSST